MYSQTEIGCEPHFVLTSSAPAYLSCLVDESSVLKAVRKLLTNENNVMKGAGCSLDLQSSVLEGATPGGFWDALGHFRRLPRRSKTAWEASNITLIVFWKLPGGCQFSDDPERSAQQLAEDWPQKY